MRSPGLILLIASLLLCGSPAAAQDDIPRVELFIQGGPSFFSSVTGELASFRVKNSLGTTGRAFVGGRYYFNAREALEVGYGFSPNRAQRRVEQFPCTRVCLFVVFPPFRSESMKVHSLAFSYVRYLRTQGRVRPFATGGLGFTVFDPQSAFPSLFPAETQFTGNFGGGVDFQLSGRIALRSEIRDSIMGRPSFAGGGTAHHVTPSVGLAFALAQQDAARGEPTPREAGRLRVELFIEGGASWFSGRPSSTTTIDILPIDLITIRAETAFATTGRIIVGGRYYFTRDNAVESSYAFTPSRFQGRESFSSTLFPTVESFASRAVDVHTFAFNYVRYLARRERLQPFVTGGLGFQVFSASGVGTEFAGNFGGGVDVRLHPRVSVRTELRDFISERPPFTTFDERRITHNVVPSLGLAFRIR